MNKKKKTLDELLAVALVPKDKQPYEIPKNWVYYKFGSIIDIQGGTQPPKSQFIEEELEGYVRLIQIRDYKSDKYKVFIPQKKNLRIVNGNDITIARYGASVGQIHTGLSGAINVALAKVIYPESMIEKRFLYWLLQTEYFQVPLKSVSRSAQAGFNKGDLEEIIFPLPPLEEQKRITNKIVILFTKIDEAQQLIKEAKETFELRRAAILDMAFRGGNIRNREKLPNGWQYKKFNDIAKVKSNLVNPSEFLSYPHIAPDNIEKHTGRLLSYRTIEEDGVKSNKHYFEKGSILYSKIRPYLSKVVIVDFEGLCSADMYPIETELNVEYLYWYMLSPMFLEQATTAGSRSVLPKINQKELGEILVPVCSLEEQEKTVANLNNLLQEEGSILNFIEQSEEDIEKLKQSILLKAFKGELGTNNSTDEPAIELLKSILQEKL